MVEEYLELARLRHEWDCMMVDVQRIGRFVGASSTCIEVPHAFYERIRIVAERIRELAAKYPEGE